MEKFSEIICESAQTVKTGKYNVTVDGKAVNGFMKALASTIPNILDKDDTLGFKLKDFKEVKIDITLIK